MYCLCIENLKSARYAVLERVFKNSIIPTVAANEVATLKPAARAKRFEITRYSVEKRGVKAFLVKL